MTSNEGPQRPSWLDDGLEADAVVEALRLAGSADAATGHALLETATTLAQSEPAAADRTLDVCERISQLVSDDELLASCHYLRARLRLIDGRPDEALTLIASSRSLWHELGRPLEAFRTELGRTHVLDDLGRHDEAAAAARQLLHELDGVDGGELEGAQRSQIDWMRAAAFENLGAAYGLIGEYDAALDACRSAEAAYDQIGSPADKARSRANRGVALLSVGQAVDGLSALDEAAGIFLDSGDQLSYAKSLGHAADAEVLLGRYADALARYEQARRILDTNNATTEACRIRLRTVRAYLALNLTDEAEQLSAEVGEVVAAIGLDHDLAEARWLHAVAKLRAGFAEDALAAITDAVTAATATGDGPLEVRALLTWCEALHDLGDVSESAQVAKRALALVERHNWPTEAVHVRLMCARLSSTDPEVAAQHLAEAMRMSSELPLPHLRYPVLLALGRHARRIGDTEAAVDHLEAAVEIVEHLRGRLPDEAIRTSYLDGRTAAHAELISMLVDGADTGAVAAFDLAEASKARTLNDIVAGVVRPTSTTHLEADLDAAYSALIDGDVGQARLEAVSRRAEQLEQQLRIAQLQAGATATSEPRRSAPSATARPDSADHVIEYHVVDDELFAFAWSRGRVRTMRRAGAVSAVARHLTDWDQQRRRYLTSIQLNATRTGPLVATAERVLAALWSEVMSDIVDSLDPDAADLVIVPHGPLHHVPFHALAPTRGEDRRRLGERWNLSVAPSFAVSQALGNRRWSGASRRSLVLGVGNDAAPLVTDEARFVAETLPGADLFLADEATSEALMANAGDRAVIHLACHGIHRDRNPMFSALRLSDRWLTAREILSLPVSDSLVVLSACETGRQNGRGSVDEAIGLARAFVAAGACAVVVSLWLAGDAPTSLLMQSFYTGLLGGQRPAAALAAAQDTLVESHPHPADWAPFVVHGGL